jgi:hypothetical protein
MLNYYLDRMLNAVDGTTNGGVVIDEFQNERHLSTGESEDGVDHRSWPVML